MPIPKVIHYFWFGGSPKNKLVKHCIDSWKKHCPDYTIIEWNESNYDVTKNLYMYQAYQAKRWGFVSDFARLDVVYQYGGIYLDTDVELVKSLDELLLCDGYIGFEAPTHNAQKEYSVNTGQGFGAIAGCVAVRKMLEEYDSLSFENSDGTQNLTACPTYNTRALRSLGLLSNNSLQNLDGFVIYPSDYFCPMNWRTKQCIITKNTYSIHHFTASWLSVKEKKKRHRKRQLNYIVHIPHMFLKRILGEPRYESMKNRLKQGKQ